MRIKFIAHEDYDCDCIGQEWQGELKPVGHTIVAGHRIAANGILKPFVEDITQYLTELVDGVETKVEVIPSDIPELPTLEWLKDDIIDFMELYSIPKNASDTKSDLIMKINLFYGMPTS